MDVNGGNRRALTASLDRSVESPVWAADGRSIYVSYDDHGETRVARVGLDGSIRTVAEGLSGLDLDRPYTGGSFSVARDGSLAFTGGSATRPSDVVLVRGGARRQLTRLNAELLDNKRLGEVRRIEFASSFDSRPIEAWLTLPPSHSEGQRHPLILEIHGGPFAAYGPHFSTDNQLYAAAGYAVLSVNPRGSTSYGAEFANLIHHAYPGNDYDDLISAVDAAVAQGFADPGASVRHRRLGGGVLTAWIVGRTNRFRAAATQKPVIDWSSFALTADGPAFFSRYWFGAYPWENPEAYWQRSPLSLVGNVQTPTLVVVGSEDYRTPVSEAEQYYTALQLRGVPTALVKVPGASHGGIAARPSQSGAKATAILAWFERYRNGAPARGGFNNALGGAAGRQDFGEPGAGLALRFGDLARGHFLGNVGPAFLGHDAAVQGREVEPFVRLDQVDANPAAARRISDAEFVERLNVAGGRVGYPAFDQKSGRFCTVTHLTCPPWLVVSHGCRADIHNKWLTPRTRFLFMLPDRHIVDEPRPADPRRGEQAAGPVERDHGLERVGVAQLDIVDRVEARRLEARARPRQGFGDRRAGEDRRRRFGEGAGQGEGGGSFGLGKIDVARGKGEAVGVALGRHADDLEVEVEVAGHAADDGELLIILLAEQGDVGPDLVEQLGDDGRDAVEMAGTRGAVTARR